MLVIFVLSQLELNFFNLLVQTDSATQPAT